jgi:hypothetical protein
MMKFSANVVLKRCNQDMWDFLGLDILNDSTYLAGGAFRHLFNKEDSISDFDIFFQNLRKRQEVQRKLVAVGAIKTFECPEGKLYSYSINGTKVQLITDRSYATPDDLLEVFDINACRFCLYQDAFYTDRTAIDDVKNKRITFNKVDYPIATMKRIAKYIDKGYYVPTVSYEEFVLDIYEKGIRGDVIDTRFYID